MRAKIGKGHNRYLRRSVSKSQEVEVVIGLERTIENSLACKTDHRHEIDLTDHSGLEYARGRVGLESFGL